jgi:hypothetical protein
MCTAGPTVVHSDQIITSPTAQPRPNAHSIKVSIKGIYSHSSRKILSKFIVICSKLYAHTAGPVILVACIGMLVRLLDALTNAVMFIYSNPIDYCTYTLHTHRAQVYYSLSNLYSIYRSTAEFIVVAPAITIIAKSNVVIVYSPLWCVIEYLEQTVEHPTATCQSVQMSWCWSNWRAYDMALCP